MVSITLTFYIRNYIESPALSTPSDYAMEQLTRIIRSLRSEHHFRGYIHLKSIPDADPEQIRQAGPFADRLSINIENADKGVADAV
ncbi:MAG TPA: hypothetical protein VFG62_00625, partial [Rhodopila sp.]|nr:hypothetical protein [Rhodopila sp.]